MKQKVKMALAYFCVFLILGTYVLAVNVYDVTMKQRIAKDYIPVQARILKRWDLSWDWSYNKMNLYVEYSMPEDVSRKAWVLMPVSGGDYPQEYVDIYVDVLHPDKPRYPQSETSIIVGWVFVGLFYSAGAGIFCFFMFRKS